MFVYANTKSMFLSFKKKTSVQIVWLGVVHVCVCGVWCCMPTHLDMYVAFILYFYYSACTCLLRVLVMELVIQTASKAINSVWFPLKIGSDFNKMKLQNETQCANKQKFHYIHICTYSMTEKFDIFVIHSKCYPLFDTNEFVLVHVICIIISALKF